MKINKVILVIALMLSSTAAIGKQEQSALDEYELSNAAANVISSNIIYAKKVQHINGKNIVDIIVLDKLCHVSLKQWGVDAFDGSKKFRATDIVCESAPKEDATKLHNLIDGKLID